MTGEIDPFDAALGEAAARQAMIEKFQVSTQAHRAALREYVAEHEITGVDEDGYTSIAMLAARLEQTEDEQERRDLELSALAILLSPEPPPYLQALYDGYLRIPEPQPHEQAALEEKLATNALIGQRVQRIQVAIDTLTREHEIILTEKERRFLEMAVSGIYLIHFQANDAERRDVTENLHISIQRSRLGPHIGRLIDQLLQFDFSEPEEPAD